MIKFKKGLDLPIKGKPEQTITQSKDPSTVAMLGPDFVGMKPTMEVRVADTVKLGQVLFTDKKNPVLKYTSPGAGEIVSIHRGEKRAIITVGTSAITTHIIIRLRSSTSLTCGAPRVTVPVE